jgi:hypothetical protein
LRNNLAQNRQNWREITFEICFTVRILADVKNERQNLVLRVVVKEVHHVDAKHQRAHQFTKAVVGFPSSRG